MSPSLCLRAVRLGSIKCLAHFLSRIPTNPDDPVGDTRTGVTAPLTAHAILRLRPQSLALLLAHGADPEARVAAGVWPGQPPMSLMELAEAKGSAEMVRMVREAIDEKERGKKHARVRAHVPQFV